MGLAVAEQLEDLFHRSVHTRLGNETFFAVTQTDIAQSAVVAVRLSEVLQKLAATTDMIVCGVCDDGGNTLAELRQTLFIDGRRELQELLVFPSLGIADVGCLLLGDEVEDVTLAETDERLIELLWLQASLTGDEVFVDVMVVGEESAVVAQQ